jgi:uncharacterized protein YukE
MKRILAAATAASVLALAAVAAGLGLGSAAAAGPTNTKQPSIAGTPREGLVLTASPGTWTGTGAISYAYQWQRCSSAGTGCANITATGSTYTPGGADVGHTLRVVVTATDSTGNASANSDPTSVVGAAVDGSPSNTARPTISGTVDVGKTLTAAAGNWAGDQPISYTYAWQRCDANGNACTAIAGASSQTYTLAASDAGSTFRVLVTAKNAAGSGSAISVPTAQAPPSPAGIIMLPNGTRSIPADSVALPNRLLIDRVGFTPRSLGSHASYTGRFRVSDTRGFVVRGALVYVVGLPYAWQFYAPEVVTGTDGWATLHLRPRAALPLGKPLVLFVRARAKQDRLIGGVSTRRLVEITSHR